MESCVRLRPRRGKPVGGQGLLALLALTEGSCGLPGGELALAGDLLVLPGPALLEPAGPCRLAGVRLCGSATLEYAQSLAGRARLLPRGYSTGAHLLMDQLTEGAGRLHPAQRSALAYSLLCGVAQALERQGHLPLLVEAALGEIREHYAEVYGVEELADTLMVSKNHLIRSFTAALGLSPGRFLTLVRVENAKRLLLHGDYTLEVVASLCGFSGANYLCRVFRRETGMTPSAYRRQADGGYQPATALEEQVYL